MDGLFSREWVANARNGGRGSQGGLAPPPRFKIIQQDARELLPATSNETAGAFAPVFFVGANLFANKFAPTKAKRQLRFRN